MLIPDGLHLGLPAPEYHADPALGSGSIKDALESIERYRYRQRFPLNANPAMALGSLAHVLILEPDTVADAFVTQPDEIKTRRGKAWDAFVSEAGTRTIVKGDDYRKAEGMARAIYKDPLARRLIAGADHEVSAFWTDDGVRCKARIDSLPRGGSVPLLAEDGSEMEYPCSKIVVDLKTTKSAAIRDWTTYTMERLGRHIQAGHYMRILRALGLDRDRWVFVVVEQEPRILDDDGEPAHVVKVYEIRLSTLAAGEARAAAAVRSIAAARESGIWTSPHTGPIKVVGLTEWAEEADMNAATEETPVGDIF